MIRCTICSKEMKFVEGDVIHEDNWYHGACLKIKNREVPSMCVQNTPLERKHYTSD
jgi:hypothetical protein